MLQVCYYRHMLMKDKLHLLFWESGGIISNVCAGPYKFTTNRLADGILEPACTEQELLTSSNQGINALAVANSTFVCIYYSI